MSLRVAVVDYGMGNLDSVARALEECGASPVVTDDPRHIAAAAAVVLPGVGAFAKGIANLRDRGLDRVLVEEVVRNEVPLLGICLGMQLLATSGSEGGHTLGLGLVPGHVSRIEPVDGLRVPHVGWNEVYHSGSSLLLKSIPSGRDFYFVHSYQLCCEDAADVAGTVPYGADLVAAVTRGSVAGVQFHPEKSQRAGFRLLRNFLDSSATGPVNATLTFAPPRL